MNTILSNDFDVERRIYGPFQQHNRVRILAGDQRLTVVAIICQKYAYNTPKESSRRALIFSILGAMVLTTHYWHEKYVLPGCHGYSGHKSIISELHHKLPEHLLNTHTKFQDDSGDNIDLRGKSASPGNLQITYS